MTAFSFYNLKFLEIFGIIYIENKRKEMSYMTIKELVESKTPSQVMFYDGEGMSSGILFGEHIICGCCGGVFDVYDVVTMAQDEGVDAIRMFETWADISDEIKGDDMCAYNTITLENGGYV